MISLERYAALIESASTGEFMLPEHWAMVGNGPTIGSHFTHYAMLARQIGPEDDVLDLGCGCGLATRIYRLHTSGRVVAVDRPPAIDIAHFGYPTPGVEYVACEFTTDALPRGQFDLVAFTEVYEHLDEALGHRVIEQVAERLRPCGRLLMSVPLLSRGPRQAAANFRHHVRDFTDEAAVLGEVADILRVGQSVALVSMQGVGESIEGRCRG